MQIKKNLIGLWISADTKRRLALICFGLLITSLFIVSPSLCKTYEVTVRNIDGYSMPSCGGTIEAVVYDRGYYPYSWKGKSSFSGGERSINVKIDVPDRSDPDQFHIYQTPKCSLKSKEFWGGNSAWETDFTRERPYIRGFTANGIDASREISGTVNSPVSFRINIKSNMNTWIQTNPTLIVKKGSRGTNQYIYGDARNLYGSDTWLLTYTPTERGTYYFNACVYAGGDLSDQWDWVKMQIN
ncbi:MAG: hypothetical protein WCY97_08825 [Methanothrix sp.]|jgi:hypothetical protein